MKILGLDPGTAFFQTAEQNSEGEIEFKEIRNAFVELEGYQSQDIESILKQNNWQYVSDGKNFFIIGEDCLRVSLMFPKVEIRRPMQDGVLNKDEDKKMLILASIIENAIGKAPDDKSLVCFCVSSPSIDKEGDNVFHKNRLEGMIKRLGYNTKCIDEGYAIILSERSCVIDKDGKEIPYSGIAISFGAGRTNCVLAYRGLQVIGMSSNRCGDWIDKRVSEETGTPISQVIHIKENKLDFDNVDFENDIIFALDVYYTNLIQYLFKNFAKKFSQIKSQFEAPLDIILAGGTSMPNGFENKVKSVVKELDLPFKIKDVKKSKDPRNSVVRGLLVQALISHKKLLKEKN